MCPPWFHTSDFYLRLGYLTGVSEPSTWYGRCALSVRSCWVVWGRTTIRFISVYSPSIRWDSFPVSGTHGGLRLDIVLHCRFGCRNRGDWGTSKTLIPFIRSFQAQSCPKLTGREWCAHTASAETPSSHYLEVWFFSPIIV